MFLKVFAGVQKMSSKALFQDIRVLNKLFVEGFVNGRNMSLLIHLNGEDIRISSPMYFKHLQSRAFSTEHLVNGNHFESWYNNVLKYNDSKVQQIKGFWQINQLRVAETVRGEDTINGNNLKNVVETFKSHRPQLQSYESALRFAYWKMCSQIRDYFASPLRVGCSFKHFDMPIELRVASVSSILTFRHREKSYMILSTECISRLYLWISTQFKELWILNSGIVKKWTYVPGNTDEIHLIALNQNVVCLNVVPNAMWVWNSKYRTMRMAMQLGAITDVTTNPLKMGYFYILNGNTVKEMSIPQSKATNEWQLESAPASESRFLPPPYEALEVLIANGPGIQSIKIKPTNRYKRHWQTFGARSKRLEENYRIINDLSFMNKTAFLKLIRQKIKAITRFVGPTPPPDTSSDFDVPSTDNPNVGGAIFDDIQATIKDGVGMFTDSSANVLSYFESKYDVEGILDAFEENLLSSPPVTEKHEEVVGGAIFDDLQSFTKEGSSQFIDLSAKALADLDKIIDLEEIFDRLEEGRTAQVGNETVTQRFAQQGSTIAPFIHSQDAEVVALNVGTGLQIRTLYGVSSTTTLATGNDAILIYENLMIKTPLQVIPCNRPSSLTAWKMDQETLLIFLEDKIRIQIYVFRGMLGFKPYIHVNLPVPAWYLTTAILPWAPCGCMNHFLGVVLEKSVQFLKAETVGHCMNEIIECTEY